MDRSPQSSHNTRILATLVLAITGVVGTCGSAFGQGAGLGPSIGREPLSNGYPSAEYYFALDVYRSGDLERAIDAFEVAIGRTRKDINGHWIDAIPVYAIWRERCRVWTCL